MDSFTPVSALLGGAMIGLASAILWLGIGRIAGISGMYSQLRLAPGAGAWRIVFLVALVAGALLASLAIPGLATPQKLVDAPAASGLPTAVWLAVAGLLIGLGTRLANGCTSGHGICGLARLSPRSFAAVATFFAAALLTVAVTGIV